MWLSQRWAAILALIWGGFLVLKSFSDVVILIEGAMCVYTDFHPPGKAYVENGSVCVLPLSLPSIYCDRKGSSESWLERELKGPADVCHEKLHSFLYRGSQLGTSDSSVPALEEVVLQI